MDQILNITFAVLLTTLLCVPFFMAFGLLFPGRLARAQDLMGRIPGRCFGIGAVNFTFMVVISLALFSLSERVNGILKVILVLAAAAVGLIFAISFSLGLAGMAHLAGERLALGQSRWQQTLWGTLLLGFGSALPLLGWFLLFPYIAWVGMGATILGWLQRKS